jgi:hypothetical protein
MAQLRWDCHSGDGGFGFEDRAEAPWGLEDELPNGGKAAAVLRGLTNPPRAGTFDPPTPPR